MFETAAIIAAGAILAGFVSGLAGFGTGLVALGFWLHAVGPLVAAPLVAVASVAAQFQSIGMVRHAIVPARIMPFLLGGIMGLPAGVWLLTLVEAEPFRLAAGVFLVLYSSVLLSLGRPTFTFGPGPWRLSDGSVGLAGGILGGVAGLSGALPTAWCGLRGWNKDEQRGVYQPYNLTILALVLGAYAIKGLLTNETLFLAATALPGTFLGTWLGKKAYRQLGDLAFRRVVLFLLLVSGLGLVLSALA